LSATHDVTGVVREIAHESEVSALSAKTLVIPLDTAVEAYALAFQDVEVVYYCSGYTPAPGASSISREEDNAKHKAEGYDDAVKVFDAIEAVKGPKPRLIMMSGSDLRDPSKGTPAHYVRSPIVPCILCAEWGICASTERGGLEDVQHAVRNHVILDEVEVRGGQEPD
jgi:hypothetical protein